MNASMELFGPLLAVSGLEPIHTVVIGIVESDPQDIGKHPIAMLSQGVSFEVADFGMKISPEACATVAREHPSQMVPKALRHAGLTARMMGAGAPIAPIFANEIGADRSAAHATNAVGPA